MVAHAVRQTMRDDDLHGPIDSGLRVVALDVAILGLQDAALRIGEVALRLAIGLRFRRCRRPAALFPVFRKALLLCLFAPPLLLFGGGFGLGLQRGLGFPDLLKPLLLVGDPIRHLVAALVAVEPVVLRIGRFGSLKPAVDFGLELRLPLLHALVAHGFVLGGVASATCPSFTKPACSASCNTCTNRSASLLRWRRRNSEIVRKSGGSPATIIMKSARSTHALAIRREEYSPLA